MYEKNLKKCLILMLFLIVLKTNTRENIDVPSKTSGIAFLSRLRQMNLDVFSMLSKGESFAQQTHSLLSFIASPNIESFATAHGRMLQINEILNTLAIRYEAVHFVSYYHLPILRP